MENRTVECKGYLLSAKEVKKYLLGRIPAFTAPKLSEKAKKNGAWKNSDTSRGYVFTRSSWDPQDALKSCKVYYVTSGGKIDWYDSNKTDTCLSVAFQVIYDPNSNLVINCKEIKCTTLWNERTTSYEYVTSKAPVITSDGKDFIWLNKEECENGTDKTMILYPTEALNKAVPFDRKGNFSDWGMAEELRKQCNDELLEYLPEELKKILVTVEMSSEDGYEKVTPILENEQRIVQERDFIDENTVEGIFDMLLNGDINEEELQTRLKDLSQQARNNAIFVGDYDKALEIAKKLGEKIANETQKYVNEMERRRREAEENARKQKEVQDAFEDLNTLIENIGIG